MNKLTPVLVAALLAFTPCMEAFTAVDGKLRVESVTREKGSESVRLELTVLGQPAKDLFNVLYKARGRTIGFSKKRVELYSRSFKCSAPKSGEELFNYKDPGTDHAANKYGCIAVLTANEGKLDSESAEPAPGERNIRTAAEGLLTASSNGAFGETAVDFSIYDGAAKAVEKFLRENKLVNSDIVCDSELLCSFRILTIDASTPSR